MDNDPKKSEIAKKEEEILKFWQDHKIFEKSLAQEAPQGDFTFYDGPPFATGTPHYGHIIAGTIKDVIPRYKTMRGYRVRRRWGWDCHGLPIENIVEKEFGLKTKKDILDYGIENFNARARELVLRYANDWKKIIPRLGRFVDMADDYRTLDASYSETTWWIFKQLYDQGLIYEGYKSMQICPRCETTLSNFEVTQGYKDVTDISVTVEFELTDEPGTFVLAWTTTPWTLPGNVALAINPDISYVEVEGEVPGNKYILAKLRAEAVFKNNFKILKEFKGQSLIGKKYQPVFDYYQNDGSISSPQVRLENKENGWKIYGADFVTTEEGTGVVHLAPAFGEDDYQLALRENLPFIQHVALDGTFKPEVIDWAGLPVKPIDNPQATDILVLKYLATKNLLFAKEKFTHSYPHCWRCNTPLLNYATSSWFIRVSDFKNKLVKANKKVNWVPAHLRDGRFGKWLEGARDWAISRSRFWGAPLPVWRCADCGAVKVFGSFADLTNELPKSNNKYWAMRHGEAESNVKDFISADPNGADHLTEKGKGEVRGSAQKLKNNKINLIISSDFIRTKETAEIMAEELGLSPNQIVFDERLREIDPGDFTGQTWRDYNDAFGERINRLQTHLSTGGENYNDVRKRAMSVLYEIDQKYQNKNILIISHGLGLFMMQSTTSFLTDGEIIKALKRGGDFVNAEIRPIDFVPMPHNHNYELDVHRPFIDEIKFACACGSEFVRVPDVFDCWYESGSMPYAQDHYPFANKEKFDPTKKIGFPANFISEGLDQTRGWFYSLIVLGVALFNKSPYQNVVTNGLVLAEDGQKMSKSLRNYPDPMIIANRYGADALRLYLMASPAVRGEDLSFSEKGVTEIGRRIVSRLLNVLSFYQMYVGEEATEKATEERPRAHLRTRLDGLGDKANVLDRWILARLTETVKETTEALEHYEIDRSVTSLDNFIDDLSTWYLRRSRDRFKIEGEDRDSAITTIRFILLTTAKLLAPVAPFTAEMIYQELKESTDPESVHLTAWPDFSASA
ncbi:MAG: class I tRNA ligase family protein, partial [Candidatus Paceibacterota bacterium]